MEDWQADETATVTDGCSSSWCTALFWIVPAKVEGTWNTPNGDADADAELPDDLGHARQPGDPGQLRGTEIEFTAGTAKYTGTVDGNTIKFTSPSAMTATKKNEGSVTGEYSAKCRVKT